MGPAVPIAVALPTIRRWIRASTQELEEHKHLVFNIVMHLGEILLNFPQQIEDQICSCWSIHSLPWQQSLFVVTSSLTFCFWKSVRS